MEYVRNLQTVIKKAETTRKLSPWILVPLCHWKWNSFFSFYSKNNWKVTNERNITNNENSFLDTDKWRTKKCIATIKDRTEESKTDKRWPFSRRFFRSAFARKFPNSSFRRIEMYWYSEIFSREKSNIISPFHLAKFCYWSKICPFNCIMHYIPSDFIFSSEIAMNTVVFVSWKTTILGYVHILKLCFYCSACC